MLELELASQRMTPQPPPAASPTGPATQEVPSAATPGPGGTATQNSVEPPAGAPPKTAGVLRAWGESDCDGMMLAVSDVNEKTAAARFSGALQRMSEKTAAPIPLGVGAKLLNFAKDNPGLAAGLVGGGAVGAYEGGREGGLGGAITHGIAGAGLGAGAGWLGQGAFRAHRGAMDALSLAKKNRMTVPGGYAGQFGRQALGQLGGVGKDVSNLGGGIQGQARNWKGSLTKELGKAKPDLQKLKKKEQRMLGEQVAANDITRRARRPRAEPVVTPPPGESTVPPIVPIPAMTPDVVA